MINKNLITDVYSTNEVKTNKVFKGKPVYRKIIEISNINNTTGDNFISTGITDLETCVSLDGIFNVGVNRIPINFHNSISGNGSYSFCCFYHYTNKQIDILCKTAINSGHVIIEYTKTTD